MIEHGIVDFGLAKRKASERLGVSGSGALPSNSQIQHCLAERQRLFEPEAHGERLHRLRLAAAELMQSLAQFEPRLTGSVLAGTATINSTIEVHLFSASIEAVGDALQALGFAPQQTERRYRFGGGRSVLCPGFRVRIQSEEAVLSVFPEHGVRESPLSSVDRRPMQRASLRALNAMLEQT